MIATTVDDLIGRTGGRVGLLFAFYLKFVVRLAVLGGKLEVQSPS